jgi:hypothetical protein
VISGDVLIIAGGDDPVAHRVADDLRARRVTTEWLDGPTAALHFTIEMTGSTATVEPVVPMFIRPSAWWTRVPSSDLDAVFLRSEQYGTLWAAAALTIAPVLNRPRRGNAPQRWTAAEIMAIDPAGDARLEEVYASASDEVPRGSEPDWWAEDANYRVTPLAEAADGWPVRARRINPDALYEIVTVVGDAGFAATRDPATNRYGLAERSVALVHQAGFGFAAVTWAIDDDGPLPVRLNAAPGEHEVMYAWYGIGAALVGALTS